MADIITKGIEAAKAAYMPSSSKAYPIHAAFGAGGKFGFFHRDSPKQGFEVDGEATASSPQTALLGTAFAQAFIRGPRRPMPEKDEIGFRATN